MMLLSEIEDFISNNIDGGKPPILELEYYRRAVGVDKCVYRINTPEVGKILRDAIIFVSDRPNYFFLRLSISLRKKGHKTIFLSRWGVEKEQESFFDHIIMYDTIIDLKNLSNCVNCIIYVQAWVGWNFLPVYIKLITDQKVVCNINDLTTILFNDQKHCSLIGLSDKEIKMDILCEKYILENISFVTLPYNLNILNRIDTNSNLKYGETILYFPCYPSPYFFYNQPKRRKLSNPIHLLFIGGIPPDHKPDQVFRDAKIHDIVDDLLQGPFLLTIFNNPQLSRNKKNIKVQYPHFTELSEYNKKFEFRNGFPPWRLKDYSREFHYGLMLYSFDEIVISKNHYQTIVPTKLFTYIELGIPVIVIDEMTAVSEIVRENGIGVIISRNEVKNLYKILTDIESKYNTFIDNINIYRQKYNMDKMIDRVLVNLIGTKGDDAYK